jgi:hypothetical protein
MKVTKCRRKDYNIGKAWERDELGWVFHCISPFSMLSSCETEDVSNCCCLDQSLSLLTLLS